MRVTKLLGRKEAKKRLLAFSGKTMKKKKKKEEEEAQIKEEFLVFRNALLSHHT